MSEPEGESKEDGDSKETEPEEMNPEEVSGEETTPDVEDESEEIESSTAAENEKEESSAEENSEKETEASEAKAIGQRDTVHVKEETDEEKSSAEEESGEAVEKTNQETDGKRVSDDANKETVAGAGQDNDGIEDVNVPDEKNDSAAGIESAEDGEPERILEFRIEPLDEATEEYHTVAAFAENMSEENGLLEIRILSYSLLCDGEKLDLTDCEVTAEVTPTQKLVDYAEQTVDTAEVVEDIQPEVTLSALMYPHEDIDESNEDEQEMFRIINAMSVNEESQAQPMILSLETTGTDNTVILVAASQANPNFTVQYYANLDVIDKVKDGDGLEVIDTRNGGNGDGGKLPGNGGGEHGYDTTESTWGTITDSLRRPSNADVVKICLEKIDGANYKVKSTTTLTQIYEDNPCSYIMSPGLVYFNRLSQNGNYELKEVWVGDEQTAESTDRKDWTIYSLRDPSEDAADKQADTAGSVIYTTIDNLYFTNRQATVDNKEENEQFILIKEGTVIRLVCDTTTSDEVNGVNFYDYDITDGKIYNYNKNVIPRNGTYNSNPGTIDNSPNDSAWYVNTEKKGINSNGNNFAFGNDNTRTTMGKNKWNGNYLNKTNAEIVGTKHIQQLGYKGCTFGMVQALTTTGEIIYSDGVNPPDLFNEKNGGVSGKSSYIGSLTFERKGDTYTMTQAEVGDTGEISGLDMFKNPDEKYTHIWTNNFWPMDSVASAGTAGHDPMFGKLPYEVKGFSSDGIEGFPTSDDFEIHNSYFGMHYTVDFKLTEDYTGPLEYLFYGDDDMWVFLSRIEKDEAGNVISQDEGRLVCDIGGVHSSVGEYVDLWDWIKKGDANDYRLSFFYTERGESGSSCWMQFTLPSVSFSTPEQTTGQLRIEKSVTGEETSEEFGFAIEFKDSEGNILKNDYAYSKYNEKNEVISNDILIWDGANFTLKAGEYIIVSFLPNGTQYTIKEIGPVDAQKDSEGRLLYDEDGKPVWEVEEDNPYRPDITENGNPVEGTIGQVTGTIDEGQIVSIHYNNILKFELPKTGGPGTNVYTTAGALSLLFGAGLMYRKKFRGRRV